MVYLLKRRKTHWYVTICPEGRLNFLFKKNGSKNTWHEIYPLNKFLTVQYSIVICLYYKGGPPKTRNLFTKNYACILTCFNFSPLQSTLHLNAVHLSRHYFHCTERFLNSSILMSFSASAVFFFHLFYISKMFPSEDFFHPRKQKKTQLLGMRSGEYGGGSGCFWSITFEHSVVCAGVLIAHASWDGHTCWKSLQKIFTEAEHSPSQQRHW